MVVLDVEPTDGPPERVELVDPVVVICGFTGRYPDQIAAHVEELAKLGVDPPSTIPLFVPVPGDLLTQSQGPAPVTSRSTSGEPEPVLIRTPGLGDLLAVGSDHTDRSLEAKSLEAGKKACPKFLSTIAWPFDEVSGRWDQLELTAVINGSADPFLRGTLDAMKHPSELISTLRESLTLPAERPAVLFLGTLGNALPDPALDGEQSFAALLRDPDTDRTLRCSYTFQGPDVQADTTTGGKEVTG